MGKQKRVLERAVGKIFILKCQAKHALCPTTSFFFFFQEGKLYFLTSSPHEWLCGALLMGSAKLWSPYGVIGRKGGKLERTTRELCMIFFDELIIQKFHKS